MDSRSPPPPPPANPRLLEQVRVQARALHYSLRIEEAYVYWIRFFIRWSGMRHPRDMGAPQVQGFLAMLASERKVSPATHNQALSALLFLYRQVLNVQLPWLDDLQRPAAKRRIPSVLTQDEVRAVLSVMQPPTDLIARLLYGTGMRLMEGLRLRVNDLDVDHSVIVIRQTWGWFFSPHVLKVAAGGTASPLDTLA